jgi:23S rRNA (pseudouridine1915-N3)-methyltransferase
VIQRATIVAVGRLKGWATDGCDDYLARLRRYFPVEVVEVPEDYMNRYPAEEVLAAEGERLFKRLPAGGHVAATRDAQRGELAREFLRGEELSSLAVQGDHVAFVVGGPLGISPVLLERADERLSFGPITLPHALARVVLLEQLYRALKIERGEKCH